MAAMEAILRKQLKQWQHEFRAQHGREPSKEDIQRHPEVASTYDTWRAISKASGDAPRSRKRRAEASSAPAAPSTPVKVRKPAPPSPANPFRSPGRRPPAPGGPSGAGPSRNPFRSPQKPQPTYSSPARARRAPAPPADSDISDDDDGAPSMLVPGSAPVASPEAAPAARAAPAPPRHYTPRTKARKRLRGEDVRTPPSAKRQGASMSQASLLLAPSPRGSSAPAKRRIFSAPRASLEERASSPEDPSQSISADEDMIGPSPQRPRPRIDMLGGATREFRPLFRTTSQDVSSVGWPLPVAQSGDSDAEEPQDDLGSAQADPAEEKATPSGHASPQVPASQPAEEDLALDLEEPGELGTAPPRISVRPYRRYGSARAQRSPEASDEEFDALVWSVSQGTEADGAAPEADMSDGAEALPGLTGLSLHSPVRHMQRATERQRERADALVHGLLDEDDVPEENVPSTGVAPHRLFRRAGRSGLDVEEDESGAHHGDGSALSDDAWASEASSADYGLGDGEMDATDVLDM